MPWCWLRRALAGAALGLAGCGDYRAVNEANPEFQRAEAARQAGRCDAAIAAYQECLRLAPGSYRAHLQLALLFENQRHDLPQAIVHYEAYLATPKADNPEGVGRLLNLAKGKYLQELQQALAPSPAPVTPAVPAPAPSVAVPLVAATPVPVPAAPAPAAGERTYVVAPGDSLAKISRRFYGTANEWQRIFDANRKVLPTAEKVVPGQALVIPPAP